MVNSQRTLRKSLPRKYRKTDIVIRSSVDKFGSHLFCGLKSVRFQILSQHTCRNIHSQHNVNTFNFSVLPIIGSLRSCKHQHYHYERTQSEQKRSMDQIDLPAFRRILIHSCGRYLKSSLCPFPAHHIPYYVRYKQNQ